MSPLQQLGLEEKQAADWAWSAASTGLSQAEGLREFRAGGGHIRDSSWAQLYQAHFAVVGWREDIKSIPLHWTTPEHMFEATGTDWGMRYNYIAEVEVWSNEEQRWITKHAQAQDDELHTHAEWRTLVEEAIAETSPEGVYDVDKGIRFLKEEATRWARD